MADNEKNVVIASILEEQEAAINSHPPKLSAIYFSGRNAFLSAAEKELPVPPANANYSAQDLLLFHRYMLSSSFISAWYHLVGDKDNRDKAAHSCSLLISSYGPDPENTMREYIKYEQLWRRQIRSSKVIPSKNIPVKIIFAFAIVAILIWILF